ncbi:uncharacterized protein BCR38DRAFT_424781 [Pseudomassariella vexata]|uniref:Berberine/berberine-like domain-containing protein n=1 Tax=Pseudomassariella vexata TaxID=1141098 RepID=A0A1Y2ECA6_9PEZI|nr:uncharacterized protein BCR38DRAFT_424781 [Pseudomassariella vexata]ORY68934.1 hypothetical protein BCR38DRAFT_424781 [Pseudomassariella vexata]
MSAEYGWAANQVLEYTLVLANASILKVTRDNYPDIFTALTAGGNNFGIVTSYLLQVYPQGEVWGGNLVFNATPETTSSLLAALRDFTENYPDEKAGIIMTSERTLGTLVNIWILFLYYNGPEPPPGVFDKFLAVGPNINSCKTQSMADLVEGNNWAIVKGSVYTIGTETTPVPSEEHGAEVLGSYYDHWVNVSNSAAFVTGVIASIAFQPLPKSIARAAKAKGGDLIDLDTEKDLLVIELDYSFSFNSDYEKIDQTMRDTYEGLRTRVQRFQEQGKLEKGVYLPLFMNDCFYPQDYFGRLRPEGKALAGRVTEELDPNGVWRDRTGGFKL